MSVYGSIYREAEKGNKRKLRQIKGAIDDSAYASVVQKLRRTADSERQQRARFVIDDRSLICHKITCDRCRNIPFRNRIYLASFMKNPLISLCTNCFYSTPDELELGQYINRLGNTNKTMFQDALKAYAIRLGLEATFDAKQNIYVKSIAGEWKFNYARRPVKLFHKNNFNTTDKDGRELYHLQDTPTYTPAHALSYIAIHDLPERTLPMVQEMEKRMVVGKNRKNLRKYKR